MAKAKAKVKIKTMIGVANGFPESLVVENNGKEKTYKQEDDIYYLCYQFCSWLENLPRGGMGGATNMLRVFLREKGYMLDE